jgi:hypothetical protein
MIEGCLGGGTFCAQLPWEGLFNSPDAQMHILHMSLHGALMLEGWDHTYADRTEGCSGEGTFCAQLPWGGLNCSPDAQMYVLHMSVHGALMLEDSPALMLTGLNDVLLEGTSVLSCHGEGSIGHLMPRGTSFTCRCMVL